MERKIRVMTISDIPLVPTGVGTQSKYFIEALLKTGKFQVTSLGGANNHPQLNPIIPSEEYGEDWVIYPVEGLGNPAVLRNAIRTIRPDILWFMSDPRFYGWLFEMEDEIRPLVPIVYYHVWDNYPYPSYNKPLYESCDVIATISKVTDDIVANVAPSVERRYLPHAVDTEIFKSFSDSQKEQLREQILQERKDSFVICWNNRNGRRKHAATLLYWFREFLDEVGEENATLILHTDPKDPQGPNLNYIIEELKLNNKQVLKSVEKVPMEILANLYNVSDLTINISDAEGFGLATLESLACETPILVNKTGGLQQQVESDEEVGVVGIGLEPDAKYIIGSQDIPFIYEDRLSKEKFLSSLRKFYNMSKDERKEMGENGRKHILKNYNFENFESSWVELMTNTYEKHGSWEERKNYKRWNLQVI